MKGLKSIFLGMMIFAVFILTACGGQAVVTEDTEPASIELIDGTDLYMITLTERAAERLDIQLEMVLLEQVSDAEQLVVSYGALIYDINGNTWIYISPAPLTFYRVPVTVDYIEGERVYLLDGPPAGTEVAVVGVPELYGIDTGVGR